MTQNQNFETIISQLQNSASKSDLLKSLIDNGLDPKWFVQDDVPTDLFLYLDTESLQLLLDSNVTSTDLACMAIKTIIHYGIDYQELLKKNLQFLMSKSAVISQIDEIHELPLAILANYKEIFVTAGYPNYESSSLLNLILNAQMDNETLKCKSELLRYVLDKDIYTNIDLENLYAHRDLFFSQFSEYSLTATDFLQFVLKASINSYCYSDYSITIDYKKMEMQRELIKEALDNEADINHLVSSTKINIDLNILNTNQDLLLNHPTSHLTPNNFLIAIMESHATWDQKDRISQKIELLKTAIFLGADVNMLKVTKHNQDTPLDMAKNAQDEEIILFLQEHGAQSDPQKVNAMKFLQQEFSKYALSYNQFSEFIIKNLAAPKAETNKIPYKFLSVWFTQPEEPREISYNDLDVVIYNHKILEQDSQYWTHIILVNDKFLIPNSVSILEKNGIEVREIQEFQNDLRLYDEIMELIGKKLWGTASDAARYSFIGKYGGVYADLNFKLFRSIEDELYKYDFVTMGINFFFAAKPNHPILTSLLDMVEKNLLDPPLHIQQFDPYHTYWKQVTISYKPFYLAYLDASNQDGNIDMRYPSRHECKRDSNQDNTYPTVIPPICYSCDLLIGQDGVSSHDTWAEE